MAKLTVFAFMHTTCVYESAATMMSLHATKADAWRAMRKHQFDAWVEAQKQGRSYSRNEARKLGLVRYTRKHGFWRKAYVHKRSFVEAFEVQGAVDLLPTLKLARNRLADMLQGDEGQAWKEARKAMPEIDSVIQKVSNG